jgi:hypothetical protein
MSMFSTSSLSYHHLLVHSKTVNKIGKSLFFRETPCMTEFPLGSYFFPEWSTSITFRIFPTLSNPTSQVIKHTRDLKFHKQISVSVASLLKYHIKGKQLYFTAFCTLNYVQTVWGGHNFYITSSFAIHECTAAPEVEFRIILRMHCFC